MRLHFRKELYLTRRLACMAELAIPAVALVQAAKKTGDDR